MTVNQEGTVSVTAHRTSPEYSKIIYVPAHLFIAQTRKFIHSTISEHLASTQSALTLAPDFSSIIIASGPGVYDENTPIGKIASENDVIHAIVPSAFKEAAEMLETKKGIK